MNGSSRIYTLLQGSVRPSPLNGKVDEALLEPDFLRVRSKGGFLKPLSRVSCPRAVEQDVMPSSCIKDVKTFQTGILAKERRK